MLLQITNPNSFADFVYQLFNASYINDAVELGMIRVMKVASALAITFYFVNLAYNYSSNTTKALIGGKPDGFSYDELIRSIVLIGCIAIYLPLAEGITTSVQWINDTTSPGSTQSQLLDTYANQYLEKYNQSKLNMEKLAFEDAISDPNKTDDEKIFAQQELNKIKEQEEAKTFATENETLQSISNAVGVLADPAQMASMMFSGIVVLLLSIIRIVVAFITLFTFKILLILGPLAFAFSILPMFKNKLEEWFGTLLGAGLVFTTLNIIDHLAYDVIVTRFNAGFGGTNAFAEVGLQCSLIIAYLMCFWYTSKWVGKGDAGRVLSKAITLAAAGTTMALINSGVIAAPGVGGNNINNVASATKDAFKDE